MKMTFEHVGTVGPVDFFRRVSAQIDLHLYLQTKERDLIITHWWELPTEAQLADYLDLAPWQSIEAPRLTDMAV